MEEGHYFKLIDKSIFRCSTKTTYKDIYRETSTTTEDPLEKEYTKDTHDVHIHKTNLKADARSEVFVSAV